MAQDYVSIEAERVVRESASGKAVLFVIDGEDVWIPRSQIHEPEDIKMGSLNVLFEVAEWFAKQEGLI